MRRSEADDRWGTAPAVARTVPAVATRVGDRWVVRTTDTDALTVRVASLDDADAAVNRLRRQRRLRGGEVRVHIGYYLSSE